MHNMAEYKIQLPVFEGPLDLLLYLIRKEEVDIYEVNLTKIAVQFVEYLEQMRKMDLDVAGEFVVMAATLIWIKSKELLPVEQRPLAQLEEEAEVDPRWELIRKLVEYKKFKQAAGILQQYEEMQDAVYPYCPVSGMVSEVVSNDLPKLNVTLMDLLKAVNEALERMQQRDTHGEVQAERWTVREKITMLKDMLIDRKKIQYSELLLKAESRFEVVVTFLAILELARLREIRIEQSESFGEIDITEAAIA